MSTAGAAVAPAADIGRPTERLPLLQLLQLSVYWFGISAIWGGWEVIGQARMDDIVGKEFAGRALALMDLAGAVVALLVQPTVGSISDYTMSRWGRRKPYIAIGATLDVIFLIGLATSQTYLSIFAVILLLQVSSNFAQGPFQGYVPDLVAEEQVSLASGLMGVMSILGVIGGIAVGSIGFGLGRDFLLPTIALGVVELTLAMATVLWVREGRVAKPREGRTWSRIALETWGTDILRERSYVWLVVSRLFLLMGAGILPNVMVWYLDRSLLVPDADKGFWLTATTASIGLMVLVSAVPGALLGDRFGRKSVIYVSAAIGGSGMALVALAPTPPVAIGGAVLVGAASGAFLAVDWALMTSIIPKASSGRYMGLSNVATALGTTALPPVVGGLIVDLVGAAVAPGAGPRAALIVAVTLYVVGAVLLRPVVEPRRAGGEPRAVPGLAA